MPLVSAAFDTDCTRAPSFSDTQSMLARTLRPLARPAARCAASAAGVSSPPPPPFDPENTASSFAPFSTADLAVTAAMLRVCAYPALMRSSRRLLEASFEVVAAAVEKYKQC